MPFHFFAKKSKMTKNANQGVLPRGSVMIFSDFLSFFWQQQWRLLEQMSRTSDHGSSVSRANNFTALAKSSKYRFPRPCLVAAVNFPHTKWLPKITDYRDTATLNK